MTDVVICVIFIQNNTDKSIDEEEYILFRMNREKVVGENFREGSMEVAFELWTETHKLSRLQRRFPPLSREAISESQVYDRRIPVLY